MTVSRTWVMFTRKRQDMRSSCLANHVTPATPVTETKNCLYISCHTPLFTALVGFPCVGWDLSPSALEINSLLVFALLWWTCSLGRFGDTGSEHNKNQATGGDGIPVEPFQILKHDAVKVLHSICQQIWKVQQWPHDWKRPVFIPIPKKGNTKDLQTTAQLHSFHRLVRLCSKSFKLDFSSTWTENFQMYKLSLGKARNQRSNFQHPLDHRKSKSIPENHLVLLY